MSCIDCLRPINDSEVWEPVRIEGLFCFDSDYMGALCASCIGERSEVWEERVFEYHSTVYERVQSNYMTA